MKHCQCCGNQWNIAGVTYFKPNFFLSSHSKKGKGLLVTVADQEVKQQTIAGKRSLLIVRWSSALYELKQYEDAINYCAGMSFQVHLVLLI